MTVTVGSAQLAVDVQGEGPGLPVLLLHAGVTDRRSWRPLVRLLEAQRLCLAYDARGYGDTTYTPEAFAPVDDAVAVLDAADVGSSIVVGASSGGRTALDLALAHPDRVAALVLIAPAISGAPELEADSDAVTRLADALDAAEEAGDLAAVNRLEAWLWLDGPESPEGRVTGAERALFLEMNAKALAAPDAGEEAEAPAAWPRLEDVGCPTLVVVGALDLPDFRRIAHEAADRISAAELIDIQGAAHLPHFEAADACREGILDFVTACDRRVDGL